MITSGQLKQPQLPFVVEYILLHNGKEGSPESFNPVGVNPELCDFI